MAGPDEQLRDPAVLAAVQRRLDRIRFDLHDGPQQDIHLLALDLDLFRKQLLPSVEQDPNRERLLGRLDDLSAQLAELDRHIRQLSTSLESPFLVAEPLPGAIEELAAAFAARTGVVPETRLSGDFSELSDSQQIALLAVIREALSNVRKHSGADEVTIELSADAERGVEARVLDNGCGFDPAIVLPRARREGHLGAVGMHERIRMLEGETRIESAPGGPTVVSVVLPVWGRTR